MRTNEYTRTCKEVFEVLRLAPKSELKLIPIEVLNKIKTESKKYNENYKLEFDKMGEPKISHEAQVMILGIYREYFLGENEKNILNKKLQKNENEKEIKKAENYNNPDDIFYKSNNKNSENINNNSDFSKNILTESLEDLSKRIEINENNENNENNSLIVSENKVIMFIKNIFEKIKKFLK